MEDRTGPLKEILEVLEKAAINIEYVYAFAAAVPGSAYVVLRVDDVEAAEAVLSQNDIPTLSDEDLIHSAALILQPRVFPAGTTIKTAR